jgi:hypothetical protein
VPLCLGVRGPGIAELRSVVSRVRRETQQSYLILSYPKGGLVCKAQIE